MKKVLVVDWLDKYGGAERVIACFTKMFDFTDCFTISNIMNEKYQKIVFPDEKINVHESFLKFFGSYFRSFFFLFPIVIRSFKVPKHTDIIISSSHAVAKGIMKSNNNQMHISYFQARNSKYIWSDFKLYFKTVQFLIYPLLAILRVIDKKQAQNPDFIVSNSKFVAKWVLKTYNRKSVVIYPPVDLSKFSLVTKKQDYYVAVGRLEPYKRFDVLIKAFNINGKKLYIIGDGTQSKHLKKIAGSNIEFTGFLDSDKIFEFIGNAKGFIHAGVEDFGIAPIEAQACGTPVLGFNEGGLKETVLHKKTGYLFKSQKPDEICYAINLFEKIEFNYQDIRNHTLQFSQERFEKEFKYYVDCCTKEFFHQN